jgi:hypothetical protein
MKQKYELGRTVWKEKTGICVCRLHYSGVQTPSPHLHIEKLRFLERAVYSFTSFEFYCSLFNLLARMPSFFTIQRQQLDFLKPFSAMLKEW